MGMPKVDYDKMYREIRKADPKAITEYGVEVNKTTLAIMLKYGAIQHSGDRERAAKRNKTLLQEFEKFVKRQKSSEKWKERRLGDMGWYAEFNEGMSGYTLAFDDMDKRHFNYLIFNRCIRKVGGMSENDYLEVLKSIGVFGEFLKEKGAANHKVFLRVSKQQEKMRKRLSDYEKLNALYASGKISEEEFGERTYKLFGYDYFE